MKPMKLGARLLLLAALWAIPALICGARAYAEWYLPYTAPDVDKTIYNECVESLPLPTTRTTIGIGEKVKVWFSTGSWSDVDCKIEPAEGTVPDELGKKIYTLSKEFHALSGIKTGDAASLTITAALLSNDGTGWVSWVLYDSDTHPGACENVSLGTKEFTILIPDGAAALTNKTGTFASYKEVGTGQYIGQKTVYYVQVKPTTVNFSNVSVREIIPTPVLGPFPNGVSIGVYIDTSGYPVHNDASVPGIAGAQINMWGAPGDHVGSGGPWPSSYLVPAGTTMLTNYTDNMYQELHFQDEFSSWHCFFTHNQVKRFKTDLTANSTWTGSTEPWRGPWAP